MTEKMYGDCYVPPMERVLAIADMMYEAGMYTQSKEVRILGQEIERLKGKLTTIAAVAILENT